MGGIFTGLPIVPPRPAAPAPEPVPELGVAVCLADDWNPPLSPPYEDDIELFDGADPTAVELADDY